MKKSPSILWKVYSGKHYCEVFFTKGFEKSYENAHSDIGGAAGLALGMSLATFFGALEYLIYR